MRDRNCQSGAELRLGTDLFSRPETSKFTDEFIGNRNCGTEFILLTEIGDKVLVQFDCGNIRGLKFIHVIFDTFAQILWLLFSKANLSTPFFFMFSSSCWPGFPWLWGFKPLKQLVKLLQYVRF